MSRALAAGPDRPRRLRCGGGSAGPGWSIGRAAYARQGARVCVADRDAASAEETTAADRRRRWRGHHPGWRCWRWRPTCRSALFTEARKRFGAIDVPHHNGIGKTGGPMETSAEDLDRIRAVERRSLLLASQQVLPGMVERGRGSIIAIVRRPACAMSATHLAYSVTKAAVTQFTRMWRTSTCTACAPTPWCRA